MRESERLREATPHFLPHPSTPIPKTSPVPPWVRLTHIFGLDYYISSPSAAFIPSHSPPSVSSMNSMNSRFKGLGFGSKRKSSAVVPTLAQQQVQNPTSQPQLLPGRPIPNNPNLAGAPTPSTASSSTTSLPMNHPGAGGRPPSYTNQYSPAPAAVGRTQSPLTTGLPRTPPTQMVGGPPPINTASSGYPPGHPAQGQMGAPPPAGGPPQYGPPQYGAPGAPVGNSMAAAQYANRGAVEVEGAGRSKAQLIVGIDFVSQQLPRPRQR